MHPMHLRNSLFFLTFTLFLSGCDLLFLNRHYSSAQSNLSTVNVPNYFVILGPISDANVTVRQFDTNETLFETKTQALKPGTTKLVWGKYSVGAFTVDINNSIEDTQWIELSATSGVDVDSNDSGTVHKEVTALEGEVKLLCKKRDFQTQHLIVNIFTTIGVDYYLHDTNNSLVTLESYLNNFAKSLFGKSVDDHVGIDYRDLFAYIPNHTAKFVLKEPHIYKNLQLYGVFDALVKGEDIVAKLEADSDGDTLSLWQEILHNTSPYLVDTDGDGLSDDEEIKRGLNPLLKDSDYDGIDDNQEDLYGTSAANPDSDEDYIPDGIEVRNGTDPLAADENGNGIEDGLDGDPFLQYQWYIKSLGNFVANTANKATIIGDDLHILDVYHRVLGNRSGTPTIVQVVDMGVELKHEDLDVDLEDSFNAVTKGHDPTPTGSVSKSDPASPLYTGHGTAVAGIIAAKTNNGLGVRGIVPRARIAGSNWLEDQSLGELDRVWYSGISDDNITVCNNSWGTYYLRDNSFERILALGTQQLRHGKGRVYVFAAGNARETYGNSNLSYLTNNPYVITVASLNAADKYASYSNPGSNVLVSAYGGEHYYTAPTIMTTSLTGESYYQDELNGRKGVITVDEDSNKSYTYAMNGTSAAAPMVSGSIALVLDACPELSWRDIRWLIATSATRIDKTDSDWITNGAGLHFNVNYGYGKINPLKMIDMCRSSFFEPLRELHTSKVTQEYNENIPDTNMTIRKRIHFSESMKIEWVGLTMDTTHPFAGDLEVNLISPTGTKINIISPTELRFAAYDGGFRFSSVGFIDEDSQGDWYVEITDRLPKDAGVLKSLSLEVQGHDN